MAHMGNPNSLANLTPFTSEYNPRNGGRPKGFTATTEYQKALACESVVKLRAISNDPRAPANKRFAAFQLLVIAGDEDKARLAERLTYAEAFIDRTEGKAIQVTKVEHSMGDERPVVLDKEKWNKSKQITSTSVDQSSIELDTSDDEMVLPSNTVPSTDTSQS